VWSHNWPQPTLIDGIDPEQSYKAAITISDAPVERPPLWYAVVTADGVVRA